MTSGWFLPREDSPSVVSNRVFMIRRLNKMESQRLGNRLDGLRAEVEQSRSLISREQNELRKQLTQIREVKGNPPVSAERRKLSQELSCKETRQHSSSGETLGVQQRYRSLSTGDCYRGAPLTQLPLLNGRSRSHSSSTPVRSENDDPSSGVFRKLSGGSNGTNRNSHSGAWPGISTSAKCNDKPRQRSLSTGTYPRFSAWETIGKSDVAGLKMDDLTPSSKVDSEKSAMNRRWRQDHLDLELTETQTWALKETRRFLRRNKSSATASSEDEGNSGQKRNEAMISGQSSELASTSKERRQHSFNTNSAPTIPRGGGGGGEYKEEPSKANKISSDQPAVSPSSSRQRHYSTNCKPKLVNGEVADVPGDKESTNRNSNHQGVAAQLIRRQRSLSINCPPVILENETLIESVNDKDFFNPLARVDDDKQRVGSRSEGEEQNTTSSHENRTFAPEIVDECSY